LDWELVVINVPGEPTVYLTLEVMNRAKLLRNHERISVASGLVMIYSGILEMCQDKDGLATVLSHEIAHAIAHHSAEQASGVTVLLIGTIPIFPFAKPAALSFILEELALILCLPAVPHLTVLSGAFFWVSRGARVRLITSVS